MTHPSTNGRRTFSVDGDRLVRTECGSTSASGRFPILAIDGGGLRGNFAAAVLAIGWSFDVHRGGSPTTVAVSEHDADRARRRRSWGPQIPAGSTVGRQPRCRLIRTARPDRARPCCSRSPRRLRSRYLPLRRLHPSLASRPATTSLCCSIAQRASLSTLVAPRAESEARHDE